MNNPWRFKSSRPHLNNTKGLTTFGIIFLCGNTAMREELLTKSHQLLKVIIQTVGSFLLFIRKKMSGSIQRNGTMS